ncbi:MAG: nucleotidyltransferase domain-containing protein [Thermoanaerobaculia bacterium]
MDRRAQIERICREHDLLAAYLFGSRADGGLAYLDGSEPERNASDLDVGVVFRRPDFDLRHLTLLQVAFEDLFVPFRVDVVPLQRVDALFQFDAVDGHRVATADPVAADRYELVVMRRAAELLPIERQLERDYFAARTP